ncbi:MAG: hypothetical protein C0631_00225 [Sedimenticola sp.]|nr:MAG: hypothetical protein C0631_00225 [Sedimenticola sp.]
MYDRLNTVKQQLPRIFLTLLGLLLMAWGLGIPLLGLIGETADATVTHARRQGGERDEALPNRYNYVVSYRFTLANEETVEGFTHVVGSPFSLPAGYGGKEFKVRYLAAFPALNTPAQQASLNLEHVIVAAVGYLLAFGLWRKKAKRKKKNRVQDTSAN